jgi:GTP-binding protein HflX
MAKRERSSLEVQAERAVLAAVRLPGDRYDHADPFGELKALAEQAGAKVVGELSQNLPRPISGTYIGTGKIEELRTLCEELNASTIIFDHDLSPKQISNIEQATQRKVVDRSELILDIFAGRATTHEAKLQVELAQLEYTYPRLKAMWDHLERITGSGGVAGIGTRGPGEQQLEIDRRLVQKRRLALERELLEIRARKKREVAARNAEHFTVGIVGYTNAGKSTLFNTLTAGGAYADDRLFATLMTRTREWDLGGGVRVMLSDTVGFVRDLPHNLIASFEATLEEATHADVLLLVLDVSDPAAELQFHTVNKTLDDLFEHAGDRPRPPRLVVLNRADRLRDNSTLLAWQQKHPGALALCALPPVAGGTARMGQAELSAKVRELAEGEIEEYELVFALGDARGILFVETHAKVLGREYNADTATIRVRMGRRQIELLRATGSRVTIRPRADASEKATTRHQPAPRGQPGKARGPLGWG